MRRASDSFSSYPSPLLAHPSPLLPKFLLTPGVLLRSPVRSPRGKEKETVATQANLSLSPSCLTRKKTALRNDA